MRKINQQALVAAAEAYGLPGYMIPSLVSYIMKGVPVGGFLTAVLTNDLKEAVARADDTNAAKIVEYVKFLYNHAPMGCWGSEMHVAEWILHKGMRFEKPRGDQHEKQESESDVL